MLTLDLPWSPAVEALLDAASGSGVVPRYDVGTDTALHGWLLDGLPVAAAGLLLADDAVEIGHVAAAPRGRGYGRSLVLALAHHVRPLPLVAHTDDDAVTFYERLGFSVHEVTTPWPTPRYRCELRPQR